MKRVIGLFLCSFILFAAPSCYTMNHTVGAGGSGHSETSHRQWFALWGLIPLNAKDSQDLAGGATDYSVETQQTFLDVVINIFTGWITIYSRTITVEQ